MGTPRAVVGAAGAVVVGTLSEGVSKRVFCFLLVFMFWVGQIAYRSRLPYSRSSSSGRRARYVP